MANGRRDICLCQPNPGDLALGSRGAGARIVATGRNDFPNQVTTAWDSQASSRSVRCQAKTITDDMCIAAAMELARFAEERGMNEKDILPRMEEWKCFREKQLPVL